MTAVPKSELADVPAGRMSVTVRVRTGVGTLIAKTPAASARSAEFGWAGPYQVEARFYREFAPVLGNAVPRPVRVDVDPGARRFRLLLEDVPGHRPQEPHELHAVALRLADIHARYWGAPLPEWLPARRGVEGRRRAAAYRWALPGVLDRLAGPVGREIRDTLRAVPGWLRAWSRSDAVPPTLAHGDARADNALVDGERCVLLDWQTALQGPGPADVACLLVDHPDPAAGVVADYADRLAARGVAVEPAALQRAYAIGTLDRLLLAVVAAGVTAESAPASAADLAAELAGPIVALRRHGAARLLAG